MGDYINEWRADSVFWAYAHSLWVQCTLPEGKNVKEHTCCCNSRDSRHWINALGEEALCLNPVVVSVKAPEDFTRWLSRWRSCKLLMKRLHAACASAQQLEECRRGAANRARAITHALQERKLQWAAFRRRATEEPSRYSSSGDTVRLTRYGSKRLR